MTQRCIKYFQTGQLDVKTYVKQVNLTYKDTRIQLTKAKMLALADTIILHQWCPNFLLPRLDDRFCAGLWDGSIQWADLVSMGAGPNLVHAKRAQVPHAIMWLQLHAVSAC